MYIKKDYELATWITANTWIIKNTNYVNNPQWEDTISWSLCLYKDITAFREWKSELCSASFSYAITDEELTQNLLLLLMTRLHDSMLDENLVETNLLRIMENNWEDKQIGFQTAEIIS